MQKNASLSPGFAKRNTRQGTRALQVLHPGPLGPPSVTSGHRPGLSRARVQRTCPQCHPRGRRAQEMLGESAFPPLVTSSEPPPPPPPAGSKLPQKDLGFLERESVTLFCKGPASEYCWLCRRHGLTLLSSALVGLKLPEIHKPMGCAFAQ